MVCVCLCLCVCACVKHCLILFISWNTYIHPRTDKRHKNCFVIKRTPGVAVRSGPTASIVGTAAHLPQQFIKIRVTQLQCCCLTQIVLSTASQVELWGQLPSSSSKLQSQSNCGISPTRRRLLLLEVRRPFDTGFPALGFALCLCELDHEKGKDHHCSQEGKHRDGLTHFLVVATGHYSWKEEDGVDMHHEIYSAVPWKKTWMLLVIFKHRVEVHFPFLTQLNVLYMSEIHFNHLFSTCQNLCWLKSALKSQTQREKII